jgi:hypothetical protein
LTKNCNATRAEHLPKITKARTIYLPYVLLCYDLGQGRLFSNEGLSKYEQTIVPDIDLVGKTHIAFHRKAANDRFNAHYAAGGDLIRIPRRNYDERNRVRLWKSATADAYLD